MQVGIYLNPGSDALEMAVNSQIFVDKSVLIEITNRCVRTMQRFLCVSRPRRFGKSMAADMLAAYYERGEDASVLFDKLKISHSPSYRKHLNQYDVIKINMQEFLSMSENVEEMLKELQVQITKELKQAYPEYVDNGKLIYSMQNIYANTKNHL